MNLPIVSEFDAADHTSIGAAEGRKKKARKRSPSEIFGLGKRGRRPPALWAASTQRTAAVPLVKKGKEGNSHE